MELFPYPFRKHQKEIVDTITRVLTSQKHLVLESGTGSGKTICSLATTLGYALEHNKKIIYTTRTNAQQQQVIVELRSIRKKIHDEEGKLFGVGLQGRSNMCILAHRNPELAKGTSEELSRFCSNEKKKILSKSKKKQHTKNPDTQGCTYYRNIIENEEKGDQIIAWAKKNAPSAEEFITYCEEHGFCPYELNKLLVRDARIVVVPFVYVFDQSIRMKLFGWLSISDEDTILVVDEAHNLPDYLRDSFSAQLSTWMLSSCVHEADKFGDPALAHRKTSISKFCNLLIDIIQKLRDTYVYTMLADGKRAASSESNDAFIPSNEFEEEILSRLNITSTTLLDIINDFIAYGEKIQEYREKKGELPRSSIHKLGTFLQFWINLDMQQYIKLVVDDAEGKNPRIEAYCLDPSVGTRIIQEFHASVHMSGTLQPLEEYRDSIGLPSDTTLASYPSPFPRENRQVLYVSDVTTKYDEIQKDRTIVPRMQRYISDICNTFPKNTMVFFPSFNTMSLFRSTGICNDIQRCLYIEEQHMSQSELMDIVTDFREASKGKNKGAALFSVMGGRISEGMDFPGEQLEIAVIAGIPYPKPTARQRGLQRYYDLKFGKGWEYTVTAPTARKLLQSIGRLIRHVTDRGVVVILDWRAPRFQQYIHDMAESKNLLSEISNFMNKP